MEWQDETGWRVEGPISVPEHAYAAIKSALLGGHFKSGDVLIQDDIAKNLGFSRVPVREALKRLEGEGFVVLRPRRGYVVVDLNADAVEDILDVRMELEGRAGYLATLNRTEEDVAEVRKCLAQYERLQSEKQRLQRTPSGAAWRLANRQFHERLFQPCRRPYLLRLLNQQYDLVTIYISIGGSIAPDPVQTAADHNAIMEAYARQDADEVSRLSREHVEHTKQRLVSKLRNPG